MEDNTLYDMALCGADKKIDGSHFVEGNIFEYRRKLTKAEVHNLKASPPNGKVWVFCGWVNLNK